MDASKDNIRQRGDVGGSAKKVGLRIKELERIYGIQHGGDRGNQDEKNSSCIKTQTQLATDMGSDVRTLQNYKKLTEMIPELAGGNFYTGSYFDLNNQERPNGRK